MTRFLTTFFATLLAIIVAAWVLLQAFVWVSNRPLTTYRAHNELNQTTTNKMKLLIPMIMLAAALTTYGSPEERAHISKRLLIQRLVSDGWQLGQESESLLVFERRGNVTQAFLMNALIGSSGTWAAERLSITIIPDTDHFTKAMFSYSVNSQNAFGQVTSVPGGNKKIDAYTNDVAKWVGARYPAKYRGDKTSGIIK